MPRRETPRDDDRRTRALLDAADQAFDRAPDSSLSEAFQDVVLEGLVTDKAAAAAGNYPPRGHKYPRR
ncbi:hypothetical protein ADL07_11670 [Streptomyces sp. NRRL F-4707]|uniref:hypothetical protein n=1 Tax=Streptomyces TaxID=1883 RepID=UPI0006AE9C1B|nr:hypothetical protein [Streptomyces sp. NRRL F-4707]KOX32819.1 hypothetical protein ADL07_11670 [Streptomyces sp. NRRL F-4707]